MPLGGLALLCPLMPLEDQHMRVQTHPHHGSVVLSYPLQVLEAKHKQPNFINNKEGIHKP
jgi:hypothetical protein